MSALSSENPAGLPSRRQQTSPSTSSSHPFSPSFPFLQAAAGAWSLASTNHQILFHLPISNLPLRQQSLCQGLPRPWMLLETPFKEKIKGGELLKPKGAGEKGGHNGHFTPACPPSRGEDPKGKHLLGLQQATKRPPRSRLVHQGRR